MAGLDRLPRVIVVETPDGGKVVGDDVEVEVSEKTRDRIAEIVARKKSGPGEAESKKGRR